MNRTLRDITGECYAVAWMMVIHQFLTEYDQFIRKYFNQG
jgi:hypothetical protein